MKNIIILICSILAFPSFAQVVNGSFENGSNSDLTGWEWTCGAESINSAPPSGGNWCIKVAGGNVKGCFPGYAFQKIPSITNGQAFTLSGWAFSQSPSPVGICFGAINKQGIITTQAGDTTTSTSWKSLSIQSGFSLADGDTAVVVLFGGIAAGPVQPYGFFDLINLQEVSGTYPVEQKLLFIVSPNPFSEKTILQSGIPLNDASIFVYDVNGQMVREVNHISEQTYSFSRRDLPTGLYFLQVIQDSRVIGLTKIEITDF